MLGVIVKQAPFSLLKPHGVTVRVLLVVIAGPEPFQFDTIQDGHI
jgi:hypothetical protein